MEANKLKQYVEQIEQLEVEKSNATENIADAYNAAFLDGFDKRIIREIIKLRRLDKEKLEHMDALLETYRDALGM